MPGPKFREWVDPATGEVVRVETTKQVNRRHRMSGGVQWTPTKGQINAAEIWNKQEEKLKRERERQERKRKNAARQAEKDARSRETQEEMLRKGRITIEDTWGKVSGSQNRLHRFFVAHKDAAEEISHNTRLRQSRSGDGMKETLSQHISELSHDHGEKSQQNRLQQNNVLNISVSKIDTTATGISKTRLSTSQSGESAIVSHPSLSPLASPKRKRKVSSSETMSICLSESRPSIYPTCEPDLRGSHVDPSFATDLPQLPPASERLMPPPPRHEVQPKFMEQNLATFDIAPLGPVHHYEGTTTYSDVKNSRQPLSEMTASQLNVRAAEKPDLKDITTAVGCTLGASTPPPMSAQILYDTIWGLSTQDFRDDLYEQNKENWSSPRSHPPMTSPKHETLPKESASMAIVCSNNLRLASPSEGLISACSKIRNKVADSDNDEDSSNFDDFDDLDVDNEILISLAATQRLKHDLQDPLSRGQSQTELQPRLLMDGKRQESSGERKSETLSLAAPQLDSSFVINGVDDEDLLQCVQDFEVLEEDLDDRALLSFIEKFEEKTSSHTLADKVDVRVNSRQALPWIKTPLYNSQQVDDDIPSSQKTEYLEG